MYPDRIPTSKYIIPQTDLSVVWPKLTTPSWWPGWWSCWCLTWSRLVQLTDRAQNLNPVRGIRRRVPGARSMPSRRQRMRNDFHANSRRPENHSKSPYFSGDYGPVRSLIFFFWFFCFQVQTPNTKYFSIYFFEITDLSVSRPILPAVFQFLHYSHSVPGRYFGTTLNLVDFTPDVSKYGPVRSFRHSSLP